MTYTPPAGGGGNAGFDPRLAAVKAIFGADGVVVAPALGVSPFSGTYANWASVPGANKVTICNLPVGKYFIERLEGESNNNILVNIELDGVTLLDTAPGSWFLGESADFANDRGVFSYGSGWNGLDTTAQDVSRWLGPIYCEGALKIEAANEHASTARNLYYLIRELA